MNLLDKFVSDMEPVRANIPLKDIVYISKLVGQLYGEAYALGFNDGCKITSSVYELDDVLPPKVCSDE